MSTSLNLDTDIVSYAAFPKLSSVYTHISDISLPPLRNSYLIAFHLPKQLDNNNTQNSTNLHQPQTLMVC